MCQTMQPHPTEPVVFHPTISTFSAALSVVDPTASLALPKWRWLGVQVALSRPVLPLQRGVVVALAVVLVVVALASSQLVVVKRLAWLIGLVVVAVAFAFVQFDVRVLHP